MLITLYFRFQKNATLNEITLKNLTLDAAGAFRCEVSAERPSYRTLYGGGNLSIIGKTNFEAKRDPFPEILYNDRLKLGQVWGKPVKGNVPCDNRTMYY